MYKLFFLSISIMSSFVIYAEDTTTEVMSKLLNKNYGIQFDQDINYKWIKNENGSGYIQVNDIDLSFTRAQGKRMKCISIQKKYFNFISKANEEDVYILNSHRNTEYMNKIKTPKQNHSYCKKRFPDWNYTRPQGETFPRLIKLNKDNSIIVEYSESQMPMVLIEL